MPGVTTAYQTGVHGSRPAATAGCILYSCTTHGLVYRSDGTTWTTWLTLPSGTAAGTPALTFGTAAAAGAASTYVATDATLPIFDATVPSTQADGDAAAAGSAGVAARRDHKHALGRPIVSSAKVATSQTTTSGTFADLATAGPSVTVTVPASGKVKVTVAARMQNSGANANFVGVDLSSGNTVAAATILTDVPPSGQSVEYSRTTVLTGLTPGSTVFKMQYATGGGTATFLNRELIVEAVD